MLEEDRALSNLESLADREAEAKGKRFKKWNEHVYEKIRSQVEQSGKALFEQRRCWMNRSTTVLEGDPRAVIYVNQDPLERYSFESMKEKQLMHKLNITLRSQSDSDQSEKAATSPRLSPDCWSRKSFNGTRSGMMANMEQRDLLNPRPFPISPSPSKTWDDIPHGRRHVSLHPIYNRNPIA